MVDRFLKKVLPDCSGQSGWAIRFLDVFPGINPFVGKVRSGSAYAHAMQKADAPHRVCETRRGELDLDGAIQDSHLWHAPGKLSSWRRMVPARVGHPPLFLFSFWIALQGSLEHFPQIARVFDHEIAPLDFQNSGFAQFGKHAREVFLAGSQFGGHDAFGGDELDRDRAILLRATIEEPVQETFFGILQAIAFDGVNEFVKVAAERGEHSQGQFRVYLKVGKELGSTDQDDF